MIKTEDYTMCEVTNPLWIDTMKVNFVEDGAYTKDVIAAKIKRYMETAPDSTIVLAAYDEAKGFVGHIIGWIPEDLDFVWIDQIWHDPQYNQELVQAGLSRLREWALARGVHKLRGETERNSLAIQRGQGWTEHGVIVEYEL